VQRLGVVHVNAILSAIVDNNQVRVAELLEADRDLALQRVEKAKLYRSKVFHWLYVGDTALHLAAAGHRDEITQILVTAGADPNATANHRRSSPLHYAADGYVVGPVWDAKRQVKTIRILLNAGADINACDKNGATALHRAVRTRCAAAVRCLLDSGADPTRKNVSGSTPFHLAVQSTGRGGAGADVALAAQREIIQEFLSRGISPSAKHGKGKSVLQSARSIWIRELLSEHSTNDEG
jgi:hypothetical protein